MKVKELRNHLQDVFFIIPSKVYEVYSRDWNTGKTELKLVRCVEGMDREWACHIYGDYDVIEVKIKDKDLIVSIKKDS